MVMHQQDPLDASMDTSSELQASQQVGNGTSMKSQNRRSTVHVYVMMVVCWCFQESMASGQEEEMNASVSDLGSLAEQKAVAYYLPPFPESEAERVKYMRDYQLELAKGQLKEMHALVKRLTTIRWPVMNEDPPTSAFQWRRLPKGKKDTVCVADHVEVQLLQALDQDGKVSQNDKVELVVELMLQVSKVETKVRAMSKGVCLWMWLCW